MAKKSVNIITDLIFVGLVTLQDPPRAEVSSVIRRCHMSESRKIGLVTMPTREVLAKERGIPLSEVKEDDVKAVVVHGSSIPGMSEDDWKVGKRKQAYLVKIGLITIKLEF